MSGIGKRKIAAKPDNWPSSARPKYKIVRNFTSYLEIARSLYLKKSVIRIVTSVRQREKPMFPMRYRTSGNNSGGTGWRVWGLEPPTPPTPIQSRWGCLVTCLTPTFLQRQGSHFTTQLIFYYKRGQGRGREGLAGLSCVEYWKILLVNYDNVQKKCIRTFSRNM